MWAEGFMSWECLVEGDKSPSHPQILSQLDAFLPSIQSVLQAAFALAPPQTGACLLPLLGEVTVARPRGPPRFTIPSSPPLPHLTVYHIILNNVPGWPPRESKDRGSCPGSAATHMETTDSMCHHGEARMCWR